MAGPIEVRQVTDMVLGIDVLRTEASLQGFRFMDRLVEDWRAGTNRFDAPGELLAGAFRLGQLVGVGGINIDRYVDNAAVGRIRHVYVALNARRRGVASAVVRHLLAAANGRLDCVRLRTDTADGAAFYEALGFSSCTSPSATHAIVLRDMPPDSVRGLR